MEIKDDLRHNRWRRSTSFLARCNNCDPSCCTPAALRKSSDGHEGMLGCKRTCWSSYTHICLNNPACRRVWDGMANTHEDRHSYSTEKCDLQTLPFARRRKTGQNNRDRLRWFLQLNTHTETSTLKLLPQHCYQTERLRWSHILILLHLSTLRCISKENNKKNMKFMTKIKIKFKIKLSCHRNLSEYFYYFLLEIV